MDAYEYWRSVFPEISGEEVDDFKTKYIDSQEEKDDYVIAFNASKGDFVTMAQVHLFFSKSDTVDRDLKLMRSLLQDKRINKKFIPAFEASAKKAKKALIALEKEEEDKYNAVQALASKGTKKKADDKMDIMAALQLVMAKNKSKGSFLDGIASKYMNMNPGKGKHGKRGREEPMDDKAFEKFQSEVFSKKNDKSKKSKKSN